MVQVNLLKILSVFNGDKINDLQQKNNSKLHETRITQINCLMFINKKFSIKYVYNAFKNTLKIVCCEHIGFISVML